MFKVKLCKTCDQEKNEDSFVKILSICEPCRIDKAAKNKLKKKPEKIEVLKKQFDKLKEDEKRQFLNDIRN